VRPRSLLILFLVVAALGAFVWFVERDLPSTDRRAELAKRVLSAEAEEIIGLVIERGGGVVRLERAQQAAEEMAETEEPLPSSDEEWTLVEPLEARADSDAVGSLVRSLTGIEKERTIEEFEREEVGLADPDTIVSLIGKSEEWILQVGEKVPGSSNVIVGVEGRAEAYVVADSFLDSLTKDPGEWRSRDAFAADEDAISKIRLVGEREITLTRQDDEFRLQSPLADEADADRVDDLLADITGLEMKTFLDEPRDLAALGLDPPLASLLVSVDSGDEIEIRLGAAKQDSEDLHFAWLDGQAFETESDLQEHTSVTVESWRSKDWSRFDIFEVDTLELSEDAGRLRLERASGDWLRDGEKIAYTAGSDLLYALEGSEASRIADQSTISGDPILEIELFGSEKEEKLTLFGEMSEGFPALRAGRESVLILPAETVTELREKIQAVRNAEVVPSPEESDDAEPE
jgi:hypothetical protein